MRPTWYCGAQEEKATPPILLEDLQGDGGVLDGHDDAAVVQVEDVVLLLEHLQGSRCQGPWMGPKWAWP